MSELKFHSTQDKQHLHAAATPPPLSPLSWLSGQLLLAALTWLQTFSVNMLTGHIMKGQTHS